MSEVSHHPDVCSTNCHKFRGDLVAIFGCSAMSNRSDLKLLSYLAILRSGHLRSK